MKIFVWNDWCVNENQLTRMDIAVWNVFLWQDKSSNKSKPHQPATTTTTTTTITTTTAATATTFL